MMSDRFPDEPSIPEVLTCPACDGIGSHYGMGPGRCGTFPDNRDPNQFHEDPECPGLGVWVCGTCDGSGKVENPIAMIDHDDDDDLDPWPYGDVIELDSGNEGVA